MLCSYRAALTAFFMLSGPSSSCTAGSGVMRVAAAKVAAAVAAAVVKGWFEGTIAAVAFKLAAAIAYIVRKALPEVDRLVLGCQQAHFLKDGGRQP